MVIADRGYQDEQELTPWNNHSYNILHDLLRAHYEAFKAPLDIFKFLTTHFQHNLDKQIFCNSSRMQHILLNGWS